MGGLDISLETMFELFQTLRLVFYANLFMTSYIIALSFVLLNLASVERKGKNYK